MHDRKLITSWHHDLTYIITAHKRSLGQGNIFTSVCHSFCPQGRGVSAPRARGLHPGGLHHGRLGRLPSLLETTGYGQRAGGTHPTGMHSCFKMFYSDRLFIRRILKCVQHEFNLVMQHSHWVAATAMVSLPMWTPPFVCIKPIYLQRYCCRCRHSVWTNLRTNITFFSPIKSLCC